MAGPSRPVITLNKAMTHTQVYILSRLTVSRDHTRKQIYPNKNSPHPPTPRYQHLCDVAPPPAISNLQPPPPTLPSPPSPSFSPGNFPLMTTALKDLTLKAVRHWVVNLILRIVHPHTHTHTHTRARSRTRTRARARTHTHTHTHTDTRIHIFNILLAEQNSVRIINPMIEDTLRMKMKKRWKRNAKIAKETDRSCWNYTSKR